MASITSGRRPSEKLGTHSTSRFIPAPDEFSALKSRDAEVYRGEIGNFPVIRNIVNGKVRLLAGFDRSQLRLPAYGAGAIDRGGGYAFRRCHSHLRACERKNELHIPRGG